MFICLWTNRSRKILFDGKFFYLITLQIGYGPNIGIVPIACNEIFQRIAKLKSDTMKFEVNFSMVEIYNEKLQDLLIDPSLRPVGGLKVREHKTLGVYV